MKNVSELKLKVPLKHDKFIEILSRFRQRSNPNREWNIYESYELLSCHSWVNFVTRDNNGDGAKRSFQIE